MIFVKSKPITMILEILLVISSMSEFMRTRKLKKLTGPLIIIYFLVGMPNIGRITNNTIVHNGYVVFGCIATIVFVYSELIISNKEKDLSH